MPGFFCESSEQPSSPNNGISLGVPLINSTVENVSPQPAIPGGYFIAVSYTNNDNGTLSDFENEFEAEFTRTSMPGR